MREKQKVLALDLHVLGTPPAFILSQDQTLHKSSSEQAQFNRFWKFKLIDLIQNDVDSAQPNFQIASLGTLDSLQ